MEDDPLPIPITDTFDLHAVPPRDVQAVVEAYLEEAQRLGYRALRIIHGKGIGVQRETVRAVLARTPFVHSYSDAPPEAGGWGATVVTLVGGEARMAVTEQDTLSHDIREVLKRMHLLRRH